MRARHNSDNVSDERGAENAGGPGHFLTDPLCCVECGTLSSLEARRWRSYRIDDPTEDEPPALAFYCPACAEREFGSPGPGSEQRNTQSS